MDNLVYQTILARRSIRSFLTKSVEKEKINLMLKAAMAAPSACNLEPWTFIVVDDKLQLEKVKKTTSQGDYNAPLAIVICGVFKHIPWDGDGWLFDCGAAAQNIMLEAQELGLASVCIGGFEEDKLKEVLDIPLDITPAAIIEIGYGAYSRQPLTWYTDEAVHYQSFDNNKKRKMRTIKDLYEDVKNNK